MLMMDEGAWRWFDQLRRELAWLRDNHPEMTALAGAAQSQLEVVRRAGSTDRCSTVSTTEFIRAGGK